MYWISVIIPVFNTEKYLCRCIESIINQTMKNIDVVLVDDGSTDNSSVICDNFAIKDERIQVIHKQNAGQGFARNDGIEIARGKYICFLDSDDYFEPDTCEKITEIMNSTGADICSFGYQIDDNRGNVVSNFQVREAEYVGDGVQEKFILHYFGDTPEDDDLRGVFSCMSAFKKQILLENNIRFPSERVVSSEDAAFCLEYSKYVKKAVTTSKSFYHYCQNEKSFSKAYREDRYKLMKAHITMLKAYAEDMGNYEKVKDRIGMSAWINLMACFKQEVRQYNYKEAMKHIRIIGNDKLIRNTICCVKNNLLPVQQRVLFFCVLNQWYFGTYIMVALRTRMRV